jgi:hypothetical protein
MSLLPNKHAIEPISDTPPKKKLFSDIPEEDSSDDTLYDKQTATLRLLFGNKQHQSVKRKGIKELLKKDMHLSKKRESLANLFSLPKPKEVRKKKKKKKVKFMKSYIQHLL